MFPKFLSKSMGGITFGIGGMANNRAIYNDCPQLWKNPQNFNFLSAKMVQNQTDEFFVISVAGVPKIQ